MENRDPMLGQLWTKVTKSRTRDVRRALADYELPMFPAIISQGLGEIRRPGSSAASVEAILAPDPGVVTRILGIVNSAAFGRRNKVQSLRHAIALLGLSEVESLLFGVAATKGLPQEATVGFEPVRFWRASARRALFARALSADLCPPRKAECFLAALLSDMALPLLCARRPDDHGALVQRWHRGECTDLVAAERDAFGLDHADAAGWMAERWSFPDELVAALASHHGGASGLAPVVYVAAIGETEASWDAEALVARIADESDLAVDRVAALLDEATAQADDLAQLFA